MVKMKAAVMFVLFLSYVIYVNEPWYNRLHLCYLQDGGENEAPARVLMKADPATRESLQAEAEVDPMEGEQTWPTESELLEAEGADTDT